MEMPEFLLDLVVDRLSGPASRFEDHVGLARLSATSRGVLSRAAPRLDKLQARYAGYGALKSDLIAAVHCVLNLLEMGSVRRAIPGWKKNAPLCRQVTGHNFAYALSFMERKRGGQGGLVYDFSAPFKATLVKGLDDRLLLNREHREGVDDLIAELSGDVARVMMDIT